MTFQPGMRKVWASSMKSALTARVPCQTLVMMSGIAVMKTTKMMDASEMLNQMMPKIAQIAEDTVFNTGSTGSKNSPRGRIAPSMMPSGTLMMAARVKPMQTRLRVTARLRHRSPLSTISDSAFQTRMGPGST